MKEFKTIASRKAPKYNIDWETFLRETECRFPFEQRNSNGGFSQFGICPSCLNPVQLCGIARTTKLNPYGRHTGKDIDGLPKWNYKRYEICPYAKKADKKLPSNEEPPLPVDQYVVETYDLLRENFDYAVRTVEKALDIRCGTGFLKTAIRTYCTEQVYAYPWLTECNLPYIFAMRGMHQQKLWGKKIRKESSLFECLSAYPNVKFDPQEPDGFCRLKSKGFLNLWTRFHGHRQYAVEGERLRETMRFCVDDRTTNTTVFEKEIEFDEEYFMSLVRSSGKHIPFLLEIAEEMMPPLLLDEAAEPTVL